MKGKVLRKALEAALALLIVSGSTPIKPVADLFGGMAITASAEEGASGQCGENAFWSFDTDTGKLTISGTGAMNDYKSNTQPWSSYKESITSVEIEYGVESIGKNAFIDCTGLTSIEIPYSVTSIGADAFYNCTNITDVYCYADPEELTWNDGGCDDFKRDGTTVCHVGGEDYLEYVKKFGDSVNVTFDTDAPHGKCGERAYWLLVLDTGNLTIYGKGDMDSADWAHYCFTITSVIIGDGITSIGNNAFSDCTDLTSVTIPDSVTSIGDSAFWNCKALTSIVIPAKVTSIGSAAFTLCTGITDVYCYADPSKLTWNDAYNAFKDNRETVCHVPKEEYDTYCSKFSIPDESHYRVNVTFAGDLVDMGLGEHLYGHSISLEGDIGVNFYMELSDELLASDTAEMVFTVPNGSKTETQTLPVWVGNEVSIGGKTYYKFKCSVSAKDMASTITAQLVDGESKGKEYTYSVKDYADYLLSHTLGNAEYEKAAPLVKAMLNYGAYAQAYFDTDWTAANTGYEDTNIAAVTAEEIGAAYDKTKTTLPSNVIFEGATLSLKSETSLSLYFSGLPTDIEFTCDRKTVEKSTSGDYVIARIRGIKAEELGNSFIVKFSINDENGSVTYSPMTYCYNVLNGGSNDEKLQNVVKALYKYNKAAEAYAQASTQE